MSGPLQDMMFTCGRIAGSETVISSQVVVVNYSSPACIPLPLPLQDRETELKGVVTEIARLRTTAGSRVGDRVCGFFAAQACIACCW
jgi:hypothetical protein